MHALGCPHLPAHPMHPGHTPRCTCNVLTHLNLSSDVPKPRPCTPSPSRAACHCHVSARQPAWQVLPVAMAILCLPEMKFALLCCSEGPRAARGSAPPATPGSAHHPASCGVAPGLSRLATPTRPSTGPSVLASKCLTGHGPAACMCQGVSFGGTPPHHRKPPSGNHTAQDQALSSGKQDMDLSQSTPHHHTEPGPACSACSACRPWHLRSPLGSASSPVQGVAS